jgi:hypothetical protein
MILIVMQFQSVRELVRAAQGMDMVIRDTPKLVVEQSQVIGAKRRDFEFLLGDLLSQRKGRAGNHQDSSREEAGVSP